MPESSKMVIDAPVFAYPNFHIDDQEYLDTIHIPQPHSRRNIFFFNCSPPELGFSATNKDNIDRSMGDTVRIYVGPMSTAADPIHRFKHAAEALGIPENEREHRTSEIMIRTLIYFMPVSIILLHHIHRTPRATSTEKISFYINESMAMRIDKLFFLLLAVHSPFSPGPLRQLKIHVGQDVQVLNLPNGPWGLPSCLTTELELWADNCDTFLPEYHGTRISRLKIKEPVCPTMFHICTQAHLTSLLRTLEENARWLTDLEISLAFAGSLFTILDACASLKHLASLTLTECDPPNDDRFHPDNDFKHTFSHKLHPLIGLEKLTIPDKLKNGYLAHWYPSLEVEIVPAWDSQAQYIRDLYRNVK